MSKPAPLPTESLNNVARAAYSALLSLQTCNVHASATQECAAQFVSTDCDATVFCCNDNNLLVLDCKDGIQTALVNTASAAVNANPALYNQIKDKLEAGDNWTNTDTLEANLGTFLNKSCNMFSTEHQSIYAPMVLNNCDDVVITLFNRSSGRIQCGIGALLSVFPQPVTSAGSPWVINNTTITVCSAVGAVGALALVACIVLAILLRQRHAAPLK